MTNPTPLSPAAAAVLRAAGDSEPGIYAIIAATLRAAADQLRKAYTDEEYVDSADDWLDGIAAELEATP